ncbi:GreA/GreB family elongation factor [Amycolatopsis echigonensis]|uniref:GreA/GreB family elongation factor n=1 Tax=Amycolatopsis echigonensis TaxID=2576905 RepID=A0A2N3WI38_9PSEU|nr:MULTISPECIES: GreA/GreB family elongation factor [Amycolatopsis]MBB2506343.1 GreA/GreB family elongation factor [Amycolatopsis echigonensis]PKV93521.1 transcription elongation GreA/GreB family factor [Amycolatopsis niigatensis]
MVISGDKGLSEAARRQLEKEIADLRAQRDALSPQPGEQERTGDAADQADVIDRAEAAARLDRQIADVTAKLEHGAYDSSLLPDGTRVSLRFSDGDEEEFTVVTLPGEDADAITSDSPLGLALANAKAGEEISYRTPRGQATATVLKLTPPAH